MRIRSETSADVEAITRVIRSAFTGIEYSSHNEQAIVVALRASNALAVSLVAEQDYEVIGHVACSPIIISDGAQQWYGLGPIAVEPAFQSQGIGTELVCASLARLRSLSAAGCVVLGQPQYYERFGFKSVPGLVYPGPPSEYFMAHTFSGTVPRGLVTYHAAFAKEA